jgi:hypothetical protein
MLQIRIFTENYFYVEWRLRDNKHLFQILNKFSSDCSYAGINFSFYLNNSVIVENNIKEKVINYINNHLNKSLNE